MTEGTKRNDPIRKEKCMTCSTIEWICCMIEINEDDFQCTDCYGRKAYR